MSRLIKLTFVGDIMCQMSQIRAIRKCRQTHDVAFDQIRPIFRDSDYVVGNLETPVTGGHSRLAFEEMRFNAPVSFLSAVKNAGIDFVTTANNHILDRGPQGVDATLRELKRVGLENTGAYAAREDAERIFVKNIGGLRFAFVAGTYDTNSGRRADMLDKSQLWKVDYLHHPTPFIGTYPFAIKRTLKNLLPYSLKLKLKSAWRGAEVVRSHSQPDSFPVGDFDHPEHRLFLDRICAKIRQARKLADVVVALPHLGGQYNSVPGPWQLKVTDALVAAGSDLVVTNHAHTPLKAEMRGSVFCAHALGNFCFTPRVGFYNDQCQADYSIILNCFFDRETKKLTRKTFSIAKSVVREDGVSVVRPICSADAADVDVICRRVTGCDERFDVQKEYRL